jgi:hypothetical protein
MNINFTRNVTIDRNKVEKIQYADAHTLEHARTIKRFQDELLLENADTAKLQKKAIELKAMLQSVADSVKTLDNQPGVDMNSAENSVVVLDRSTGNGETFDATWTNQAGGRAKIEWKSGLKGQLENSSDGKKIEYSLSGSMLESASGEIFHGMIKVVENFDKGYITYSETGLHSGIRVSQDDSGADGIMTAYIAGPGHAGQNDSVRWGLHEVS